MTRVSDVSPKKHYSPPKLTVYGDLTQLTMGMAKAKGMIDNMAMTRKT